ncbi:MAG: hypothetical protein EOO65_05465 [Methanosarcinales archaeon]|nr:MAG: hypothetical protein EOO65_05465 [Methanosarcinales archaeon]
MLNNLQQSTDSLKDMVRYEISRATPKSASSGGLSTDERQEFEKKTQEVAQDEVAAKREKQKITMDIEGNAADAKVRCARMPHSHGLSSPPLRTLS